MNRTKIEPASLAQKLTAWQNGRGPLKVRLRDALLRLILEGEIVGGDRLPPERGLAQALAISRNTVVAAYELLREDGYLETRAASGSIVRFRDGGQRVHAHRAQRIGAGVDLESASDVVDFGVADIGLLPAFEPYVRGITPNVHRDAYGTQGCADLRDAIAAYYRERGLPTSAEQILITSGGQQGISLCIALYLQRGEAAVVQNPTFFMALDALRLAGARLHALAPCSRPALRDMLVHSGARVIYVIPTHHNPTGYTLASDERVVLARAADELGVAVIEDMALDELTYEGAVPAPIAAHSEGENVICVGSLNKVFWSGLRVGWIRAGKSAIAKLTRLKGVADLGHNVIAQSIALQVMRDFDRVRANRRAELRDKMRFAADLIERELPDWRFHAPAGGFCLWIELPAADARPFTQLAKRFGVNVIAGSSMAIDEQYTTYVRLVFSGPIEQTAEGVKRLARAWSVFQARGYASAAPAAQLVV